MVRRFLVLMFLGSLTCAAFAAPQGGRSSPRQDVVSDDPSPGPSGGAGVLPDNGPIYVDALSGFDESSCGSAESPCATIHYAVGLVPMVMNRDVTISIAPGTYEGGILLAGRGSPRSARLILEGVPGMTIISASPSQDTGISIQRMPGTIIRNLTVEGFPAYGIQVLFSASTTIESSRIAGNGDGVFLGESDSVIRDSVIEGNLRHGISCEGGWISIGTPGIDATGTTIMDNGGGGIRVDGCRARFASGASIVGNQVGLLAVHGGVIDLGMRADVGLYAAAGQQAIMADCHGMVMNFVNSCVGSCGCLEENYGICQAGEGSFGSGGRQPRRVNEAQ